MPLVLVLAEDWKLRSAVRAELRERGVRALGADTPDAAGQAMAGGERPAAVVLEGTAALLTDPAVEQLVSRIPTVLVASRTQTIPLASSDDRRWRGGVFYRPVLVGKIVSAVLELLEKGEAA